jgi:xylulokinase
MYRALLEGIAFGTNHVLETYRDAGVSPEAIHAVGGGVRNNVWLQATSDISGFQQTLLKSNLGASYGDAFLAALAVGDVDAGAITGWNPVSDQIKPKAERKAIYARQYGIFRELYARNRDLMAQLEG